MDTSSNPEREAGRWNIFGKKSHKSAAVFFSQIIVIYIVVITSIINLSILDCTQPGVCNLWIAMLSSALGYLLPNPSLRIAKSRLGGGGGANIGSISTLNLAGFNSVDGVMPAESQEERAESEHGSTPASLPLTDGITTTDLTSAAMHANTAASFADMRSISAAQQDL